MSKGLILAGLVMSGVICGTVQAESYTPKYRAHGDLLVDALGVAGAGFLAKYCWDKGQVESAKYWREQSCGKEMCWCFGLIISGALGGYAVANTVIDADAAFGNYIEAKHAEMHNTQS